MDLRRLKVLWSALFDRIGHYDRMICNIADDHHWFIPMYHRILRDDEADPFNFGLGVCQQHFDQHLAFFQEHFHVCTILEGLAISQSGNWPDRPLLSITFDDGYLDNFDLALPLLKLHGCPATFFICTGAIADHRPFWWDLVMASATRPDGPHWQSLREALNLAPEMDTGKELRKILASLWDQPHDHTLSLIDIDHACNQGLDRLCPKRMQSQHIRALSDQAMEVAAHTHRHPNLTKESDEVIEYELVCSKDLVEEWTGREVLGFATPHGFVDDRVKALCSRHGMAYVASTDLGSNQPLAPNHLHRFGVADAGLSTLKRSLARAIN